MGRSVADGAAGGEHREVFETYRMLAEDRGWANRIIEAIETGLTAEAAVQKVQNDMRARMRDIQDPYLKERLSDLDDLNNRLLRHLLGIQELPDLRDLPENTILVARNMGPAELLDYDRKRLKGVVLEEGTASSHVAIVARALDIPLLAFAPGQLTFRGMVFRQDGPDRMTLTIHFRTADGAGRNDVLRYRRVP